MISDIIALAFSVIGIISVLFFFTFKLIIWRMENINLVIPLVGCDKSVYERIYNLRSFCDFCAIKEKCTIVLISYGAPEWFINEIKEYYKEYSFLKIVNCNDTASELC